jgi:hypothetical protein
MKARTQNLSLIIIMAAALAGCTTTLGPAEVLSPFSPVQYGTRVVTQIGGSSGTSACPFAPGMLSRHRETPPAPAEVNVGFDNQRFDHPTFGCTDYWDLYDHKGLIKFEFPELPEPALVVGATLRLQRQPSEAPWRLPDTAKQVCNLEVRAAATPWLDPYVAGPAATADIPAARDVPTVRLPLLQTDSSEEVSVDVAAIVNAWRVRSRPNNGLLLTHRKRDGASIDHTTNDSCTNTYSNASLTLTIRRIVPRP